IILVSTGALHWPHSCLIRRSCFDCGLFVVSPLTLDIRPVALVGRGWCETNRLAAHMSGWQSMPSDGQRSKRPQTEVIDSVMPPPNRKKLHRGRALELLTQERRWCPPAHGFTVDLIVDMVCTGLATTKSERTRAGRERSKSIRDRAVAMQVYAR